MDAHNSATKSKRAYTLKRRAEQQAETRRRIVEAAVDLHSTIGPAQTTVSMVSERAGVQRHTYYSHFPDERSLFMACSGLVYARDPPPDAERYRTIEDRRERLRTALRALYDWYERNAQMAGCVLRDAEVVPLVKEINTLRMGPVRAAYREVLGSGLEPRQQAMLQLALNFYTWRSLARESGLTQVAAVDSMVQAIEAVG
jgi:AcrR family transcriptional regulator